jgi:hypothetical protein
MMTLFLEIVAAFGVSVLSWRCTLCFGLALLLIGLTLWLVEDSALRSLICLPVFAAGLASGVLWERRRRRAKKTLRLSSSRVTPTI